MSISTGVVSRLCKHSKLIEKIFAARMLIQPIGSFSEVESQELTVILAESNLLSEDSDNNIWLNPDVEKALETLLGSGDNIDLGRVGEYLARITFEMKSYAKLKRDSRITMMIKTFNNIILLLIDNSKLVTKKRESDYGGYALHVEKVGYLQHLLHQTQRLSDEIDGVAVFISTYQHHFNEMRNETLRKKINEVRATLFSVRDTLSTEIQSIGDLLKVASVHADKNELLDKLRVIDFLLTKGRFHTETNYQHLEKSVPTTCSIGIKTKLNLSYASSEEYPERILAWSQTEDASISKKHKERVESVAKPRAKSVVDEAYINPSDIYDAYLEQDKSLLHFIESIDFGDHYESKVIDIYLEVLAVYHKEMHIPIPSRMEDTADGMFSVLTVKEPTKGYQ